MVLDRLQHRCELVPKSRALGSGSTFLPYIEITKNFLGDTIWDKRRFLFKRGKITFREYSSETVGMKFDVCARVENWY